MQEVILAVSPMVVLVTAAAWGSFLTAACKVQRLSNPRWPFAENPGLALELAGSLNLFQDHINSQLTSCNSS